MRKCILCQGNLEQQTTAYTQWYQGQLIVIENVPGWVCEQCGETYYDGDVVERIQTIIWSDQPPVRVVQTLVYDLSAVPGN